MIRPYDIIPFFVIIPLGGAFIISLIGKKVKWFPDVAGTFATLALMIISVLSVWIVNKYGMQVYNVGGWKIPLGIGMVLDGFTCFMLVTVNLVAFLITLFSVNYMNRYTSKWLFYALFLLMLTGMNGVIVTGDMFNLFVFLEIASVSSFALVAFGTEKYELEAAFKYAIMSSVGSAFILLGIIFLYSYTSTLNMADMAGVLMQKGQGNIILLVSVLFLMGFGLKAALVPFHAWLPDAHPSAPAPISAMLSGILIKTLGIYTLCRLFFNVLGATQPILSILMFMGILSMLAGVFLAIGQWDFKRLLAYHSISQIGYVVLGIGIGTPLGILGGLFHLFNHSIFKSLLFLNSGAIEYAIETRDLKLMGGLSEKMPITSKTSLIASLSIAGIPPFNGFWSKLIIIAACVQAEHYIYAALAIVGSILTLASFMKVQKYAFYEKVQELTAKAKEAPVFMCVSMILFAILCAFTGLLLAPTVKGLFLDLSVKALTVGTGYARLVFGAL